MVCLNTKRIRRREEGELGARGRGGVKGGKRRRADFKRKES